MFRFFFIIFKDSRLILTRVARPFVTHTRRKVNPFCREICELMPSRSRTSHDQRQFSSFSLWLSPIRDHASPASAGTKRLGGRAVSGPGLDNRRGCQHTVGANPTPSATSHFAPVSCPNPA